MRADGLLRRIRWGNAARLAALVALALVVAVWPRLGADPPRLPPAEPVPIARGAGERLGGGERSGRRIPGAEAERGSERKRGQSERRGGGGERPRAERRRGGG